VILLCAGYAVRLYPLTKDQPKPLLPIAGRPLLEYILDQVKAVKEVTKVFVVTNHRFAGHFERWAKSVTAPWPLIVVDDQTTSNEHRLGAIGDLCYVLKTQKIGEDDLLVVAGDNLFDFDLCRFVELAKEKAPHAVIATFDVGSKELAAQYGLVKMAKDGKVFEFFEKPKHPPTTLASCGIYWLPRQTTVLLDRYLSSGHNADQPGHYMKWLAQEDSLFAVSLKGRWYDIGDLTSYQKANAQFTGVH